jgi:hypothetical protein
MKTSRSIFTAIIISACFATKVISQTYDYTINWSDTSTYKVTCGKIVSAQWSVKNDTCEMFTPYYRAEAATGCNVIFNFRVNQSGNGGPSDKCYSYHQIDNGEWVLDTMIVAGANPGVFSVSKSVYIDYEHYVQFKIRMSTTSNTEFWAIKEGDTGISDGDTSAHFLSSWSAEPPMSTALPIELFMFNGKVVDDAIELNWATTSEINNNYFTIEKSKDVINYEAIVNVAGAGNSNTLLNYSAEDNEPFSGVSYYRLKQTDFNGKYTYSNLVKVDFTNQMMSDVNIYPNPFKTQVTFMINNVSLTNSLELKIYNVLGDKVINAILINHSTTINTCELPSGIYFYKVIGNNKTIQSGKLISQL